jgi:MFS family permease
MSSTSENSFLRFCRRNPNFLLVWLGQVLSQSGSRMYQIALLWWIVASGGDSAGTRVGIYMGVVALPSLLLFKHIGHWVDNFKARRLLVVCDWAAAVILSLMALGLARDVNVGVVYILVFVASFLQAVLDPTLNKSVSQVVEASDLDRGVSLMASTQSLANFGGAVAGAALIGNIGLLGVLGVAVAGYLVSGLASRFAKFAVITSVIASDAKEPLAVETAWQWLKTQPLLRKILFGFGGINFFATPTLVVLPIYLKRELNGTASQLALLEGALWLGMILGTVSASRIGRKSPALKVGAVCLFFFGVSLAVPSIARLLGVYAVSLAVAGFCLGVNNVKFLTLFQERVPQAWKGRFFAAMQALVSFTFPIAYVIFGFASDGIAPHWLCAIQGAGVVLLSTLFFRWSAADMGGEGDKCTREMELTTA